MSEPVRVLVVGVGSIGERHARCFLETGRADVSLCDVDEALVARVAERYEIRETYTDFERAIDSKPGAVIICTPAHLHVPMAIRTAEAGVPMLIEKPLSTRLEGVDELIRLTNQRRLVCGVAYVYRGHPVLAAMRKEIVSGRFGRPLEVVVASGQHFPHYRPAYREIYYRDRKTGGGAIQDALTHLVNAVEWIVGPVTELTADCEHLALEGVEVEDTVHVLARHGPVMASYAMNQHQAPNETRITVVCEQGTVCFEAHEHRWRWCTRPDEPWMDEQAEVVERDTAFVAQANRFLDALAGDESVACTLEEAAQTLRVNLAALEAAESRTWKTI